MKILILSKEAWRSEQNGGNVLSNLFRSFEAEFAQIYCNECLPNNDICNHYYQITDKGMLRSILSRHRAGKKFDFVQSPEPTVTTPESFSKMKQWLKGLLPIFREIVWWLGKWNKEEIETFIKEFNPDIIFAPCYGNHYMHHLTRLVHKISGKQVISYISDDHYSNKQLQFTPWYWINHLLLRKHTREIFKHYSLVYTMTDEQKQQCEKEFHANMKILRKAGEFKDEYCKITVNTPIRIVYAGGIYLNRWKTLKALVDAIDKIDSTGNSFRLDIYTNNNLTASLNSTLNRRDISQVHAAVSSEELKTIYHSSDIALHCESFDIINRFRVRFSFSTKIVDCLDSGCAVMAICDPKQAGFAYLKRNDAAICIANPKNIETELRLLKHSTNKIIHYQRRAFEVGRKNHLSRVIEKEIFSDFQEYCS